MDDKDTPHISENQSTENTVPADAQPQVRRTDSATPSEETRNPGAEQLHQDRPEEESSTPRTEQQKSVSSMSNNTQPSDAEANKKNRVRQLGSSSPSDGIGAQKGPNNEKQEERHSAVEVAQFTDVPSSPNDAQTSRTESDNAGVDKGDRVRQLGSSSPANNASTKKKLGNQKQLARKVRDQLQAGRDLNITTILDKSADEKRRNVNVFANSRPFPADAGVQVTLPSDDLTYAERRVREKHTLLISCDDREFAFFAASVLLKKLNPNQAYKQQQLEPLANFDQNDTSIDLNIILNALPAQPNNMVVVISLFRDIGKGANSFLSPLAGHAEARIFLDEMCSQLRDRGQHMLILCRPAQVRLTRIAHEVPHWQISALRALIEQHYHDQYASLIPKLEEQIERDCWGSDPYGRIREATLSGQLPTRIEQYETNQSVDDKRTIRDLISSKDTAGDVIRAALFTAAYFSRVSINDFDKLIQLFLGDGVANEIRRETTRNKQDEIIEREVVRKVPLKILWKEKRRTIFNHCRLTTTLSDEGERTIGFSEPHLQQEVREAFPEVDPFYLPDRFTDLRESGLLFDNSPRLAQNVVEFMSLMAVESPEDFGSRWLVQWTKKKSLEYIKQKVEVHTTAEDDEESILRAGLLNVISELERARFVSRLGFLIREMQGDSRLASLADDFIQELINHGFIPDAIVFVQELWAIPKFRTLHWLKRLIAETRGAESQEATKALWDYINRNVRQQPDLLDELLSWIRDDQKLQDANVLEKAVLPIFVNLCLHGVQRLDLGSYGQLVHISLVSQDGRLITPALGLISLLRGLCHRLQPLCYPTEGQEERGKYDFVDGLRTARDMLLIGRWLHGLDGVLRDIEDDDIILIRLFSPLYDLMDELDSNDANLESLIALIVLEWLAALQGIPPRNDRQLQSLQLTDQIVAELCQQLSPKRLHNLQTFIAEAHIAFRAVASELRELDRAAARSLSGRRALLQWFSERLHQARGVADTFQS